MAWDFCTILGGCLYLVQHSSKLALFWNCGSVVKLPHNTCHETSPLSMWSSYHRGGSEVWKIQRYHKVHGTTAYLWLVYYAHQKQKVFVGPTCILQYFQGTCQNNDWSSLHVCRRWKNHEKWLLVGVWTGGRKSFLQNLRKNYTRDINVRTSKWLFLTCWEELGSKGTLMPTSYLVPDWGVARTLRISIDRIIQFHQIQSMGYMVGLD